jgi:hypothetical protein
MQLFNITRLYQTGGKRIIKRGLTLSEAQTHCQDIETSSSTCTTAVKHAITRKNGAWFDAYTENKGAQ